MEIEPMCADWHSMGNNHLAIWTLYIFDHNLKTKIRKFRPSSFLLYMLAFEFCL